MSADDGERNNKLQKFSEEISRLQTIFLRKLQLVENSYGNKAPGFNDSEASNNQQFICCIANIVVLKFKKNVSSRLLQTDLQLANTKSQM